MSVMKHDNRGRMRCVPDVANGFNTRAVRQREVKENEIELVLDEMGYASRQLGARSLYRSAFSAPKHA